MAKKPSTAVIAKKAPAKRASSPRRDVPAPVTRVSVSNGKTERSVSVEKIENGYLVRESTYGPKGQYKSTTRYSKDAPVLDVKGPK